MNRLKENKQYWFTAVTRHPDQLRGPHSLFLFNGYLVLSWRNVVGACS